MPFKEDITSDPFNKSLTESLLARFQDLQDGGNRAEKHDIFQRSMVVGSMAIYLEGENRGVDVPAWGIMTRRVADAPGIPPLELLNDDELVYLDRAVKEVDAARNVLGPEVVQHALGLIRGDEK